MNKNVKKDKEKFIFFGKPPTLWCDFIFEVLLPVDDLLSMISG